MMPSSRLHKKEVPHYDVIMMSCWDSPNIMLNSHVKQLVFVVLASYQIYQSIKFMKDLGTIVQPEGA